MWRRLIWAGLLICALGAIFSLVTYEKKRMTWQDDLWPGTLAPCFRLGGFRLPIDTPTVILAGDYRTRYGLIPTILENQFGLRFRNIAENLNMGGDLTTLRLTLTKLSEPSRQSISFVIVNLSADGIDDGNPFSITGNEFNAYGVMRQFHLLWLAPKVFLKNAWEIWWPNQWRAYSGKRSQPPKFCDELFRLSKQNQEQKGFIPLNSKKPVPVRRVRSENHPKISGFRYQHTLNQLDGIKALGYKLILVFPPLDPRHCALPEKKSLCEAERLLPQKIAQDRPQIASHILDFTSDPIDALNASNFVDFYHLDSAGAVLYTQAIGDSLFHKHPDLLATIKNK